MTAEKNENFEWYTRIEWKVGTKNIDGKNFKD
jgi:hypothetical protein